MGLLIEWSPEATEDLELIAEYIARDSIFYARAVVTEILAVARGLGKLPHIGRVVPEICDNNRSGAFRLQLPIDLSFRIRSCTRGCSNPREKVA